MFDNQLVDVLLQRGASKRCLRLIRTHHTRSHCSTEHGFCVVEKEEITGFLFTETESEGYGAEEWWEVPIDLQAVRVRFGHFGCLGEIAYGSASSCLVDRTVG